jgi:excisionase family DNA binding protein
MNVEKKVFSVKEIAIILGVSVPGAYNLAARSDFPSVRLGERRIVIPVQAFNSWLEEQTRK